MACFALVPWACWGPELWLSCGDADVSAVSIGTMYLKAYIGDHNFLFDLIIKEINGQLNFRVLILLLFNSGGGGGGGFQLLACYFGNSSLTELYLYVYNHLNVCNHRYCNYILDIIKCMFSLVCM